MKQLGFKHFSGGVSKEHRLFIAFEKIPHQLCVRLANKGLFPIPSTLGYFYFLDNKNKIIGTSVADELGIKLLNEPVISDDFLDKHVLNEIERLGFSKA